MSYTEAIKKEEQTQQHTKNLQNNQNVCVLCACMCVQERETDRQTETERGRQRGTDECTH